MFRESKCFCFLSAFSCAYLYIYLGYILIRTFILISFLYFSYYLTQKKTLEINPRHPLIKELLKRVEADPEDRISKGMAMMMFQTGNDIDKNINL